MNDIRQYIENIRKELNVSERELARSIEISQTYINNIIKDKTNPSSRILIQIARALENHGYSYSKIVSDFSVITGIKLNNEYKREINTLDFGFRKQLIKDIEQAQEQLLNSYKVLEDKRKLLEEQI